MMKIISTFRSDATLRPDLFIWNGRVSPSELQSWLADNLWIGTCPEELLTLWQETGGGEIFETETFLGPLSNSQLGDDIAAINQELRRRGLSKTYVVFDGSLLVWARRATPCT